ncbi:MAG: hypothetical protein ABIR18_10405 [Chitinophagaceae bacterium]
MFRLISIISLLFLSCNNSNKDPWIESLPIYPSELNAKQGDCFAFIDSSKHYFVGIILNFHKAEDGIYYVINFTNYYDSVAPILKSLDTIKLCGRKIWNSEPQEYYIGFDAVFVRDTTIENNKSSVVGNINLDTIRNMTIGAEGNVFRYSELVNAFYRSKNSRSKAPDHYKDIYKQPFRPDEYISLEDAENWYKLYGDRN